MNSSGVAASIPTTAARSQGLPRLIYLARMLTLCFFPLATVTLGNLVILCVSQAQEALLAFDDGAEARWRMTSQAFSFEVSYVMWMVSAWYVARLLVGKRFDPDLVGTCSSPQFANLVAKQLPRLLALFAGLPIALFLLRHPQLLGLGVGSILVCIVVFVGLVFRRPLAQLRQHQWIHNWQQRDNEDIARFDMLSGGARLFIVILFVTSFGLCLALPVFMAPLGRWIGAPALLLFALMSWTIFGGVVLTYIPKSLHYPSVTWVVVVALLICWHWNENHPVATPVPGINNGPRAELGAAFVDWLRHRPNPQAPVIFIASSGGASRAAYWTTSSLGKLEDEARANSRHFADNIFVISGISGGSLGAASFVTALDLVRKANSKGCSKVRDVADGFTGRDHLSTVVGLMLFPDLVQRFLPFAVTKWDRSRGLEETWARDWNNVTQSCGSAAALTNPWDRAFTSLYSTSAGGEPLPALALSSTALGSGQAVMQTTFSMHTNDTFDILDEKLETRSLTLAQAVHNSARFPYISPGGVVRLAADQSVWDRLGDGGYVEASGTLTLSQILHSLIQKNLIRAGGAPANCSGDDCYILLDQVRVLILDNTPTYGGNLLCGVTLRGGAPGERLAQPQNLLWPAAKPMPPGPDFLEPLVGAFSTRGGRAVSAEVHLQSMVGGCTTTHFAELRLPAAPAGSQDPSMDWMLNGRSRSEIDAMLDGRLASQYQQTPNPQSLLSQNMDLVRGWFSE
jgi:hypothetical protein